MRKKRSPRPCVPAHWTFSAKRPDHGRLRLQHNTHPKTETFQSTSNTAPRSNPTRTASEIPAFSKPARTLSFNTVTHVPDKRRSTDTGFPTTNTSLTFFLCQSSNCTLGLSFRLCSRLGPWAVACPSCWPGGRRPQKFSSIPPSSRRIQYITT